MDIALGLLLIGLTAYTSTLSYALRGYSRGRLGEHLPKDKQRLWFDRLDRYEFELLVTTSVVRLVAIVATLGWVITRQLDEAGLATWRGLTPALLIGLLIILVAGIGIPQGVAQHASESVLAGSLWLLWLLRIALLPIERFLRLIEFVVRRLLGRPEVSDEDEAERMEREILDAVTEGELHGAVDEEQKEIIESVFELHDTPVSAIMTPRTDIVAISADATYDDVRRTIMQAGHSRLPVYEESLDRITSVLYAKDLIGLERPDDFDARKLARTVPFVPETKTIDELLRQLRQEKVHIAIVLDEYGGTAGLVTIEDILEELVGEIDDEYDRESPPELSRIDADTVEADARIHVDDINEALDIHIPEDGDYDTIGGFVFTTLGRIPERGEQFTRDDVQFVVLDSEPRKINRLRIHVERRRESA